jgi:uncharacterized protein (DUF488 family)
MWESKMSTIRAPHGGMVFTIGYEGRSLDDLLQALTINHVHLLVDVRENAVSRRPGFSKRRLSEALAIAGIEYRHEPLLGNPRENRDSFRNGNAAAGRRRYLRHLNNGARDTYDAIISLATRERIALLCFERDEARCHRHCIVRQAEQENPALPVARL